MQLEKEAPDPGPDASRRAIEMVVEALNRLKFGAIHLTVHEGRLVQVDVTEKHRYPY